MQGQCLNCSKELVWYPSQSKGKYCSNKCQKSKERRDLVESGKCSQQSMRGFLIEQHGAKCMLCGWDKENPVTGKCPIELDHMDGDCTNNTFENCRLICPNCHALTHNYKALNRGKGKRDLRIKRRPVTHRLE